MSGGHRRDVCVFPFRYTKLLTRGSSLARGEMVRDLCPAPARYSRHPYFLPSTMAASVTVSGTRHNSFTPRLRESQGLGGGVCRAREPPAQARSSTLSPDPESRLKHTDTTVLAGRHSVPHVRARGSHVCPTAVAVASAWRRIDRDGREEEAMERWWDANECNSAEREVVSSAAATEDFVTTINAALEIIPISL